ncbi:telomerase inhibitor [Lachancea thermotolerans CBS 6340]|uniref:Protein PXR1 n=1 Tax=Lachancea thermotolerans (strain ATCC 56472 / CBS 6340 / NRRL Y-8284) TaxID=559295 RepID=C5DDB3_LACTC|nr:KLTH0B09790p [Lachancea thermotolerans CBS 6340]CAR21774.1 KLTH0B09790p [Lachancea thermotolerans CBS 6340]
MGLAATKNKQKLGLDPRNTAWSNDTSRFGHKHLEKMGWRPGSGLGMMPNATTTHVKVSIKDDNLGLGAKLRKKDKADEFDSGECAGLDAFQRLLGRLNGKEDSVSNELDIQKKQNIINGKWGIHFVKGDVLASTWDAKTKTLKLYSNESTKRKLDSEDEEYPSSRESKRSKKSKESRKSDKKKDVSEEDKETVKKGDKSRKDKDKKLKKDGDTKDKKEKRVKKEKKDKKDKKDKHKMKKTEDKKQKHKKSEKDRDEKHKNKKDKKREYKSSKSNKVSRESMLKPRDPQENAIASRLSVRSKWIKQKRAAVMDAQALNEIFMVTTQ